MFYYETAGLNGKWWPRTSDEEPVVKRGRLYRKDSMGPRVRAVTEVEPYLEGLTLDQLREVHSPDGKFAATAHGARPV